VIVAVRLPAAFVAVGAIALTPAPALARAPKAARRLSHNAIATRTYVTANYAMVSAARANLPEAKAAIASLADQVSGECPLIASDAPQDHDSDQLGDEVIGALELAAYQTDKASMTAFAHTIRNLTWSSRTLTRMVHTYAIKLETFPALAPPDICADVQAWAASGYQALTAGTVAFDKGFFAYSIEAEEVSLRLLRPYESAAEASLLHRTKLLEAPLAEFEAEAVYDYSKILDALKLPQ
jgi:hypothetical protein